ncbi:MAG: acetyl-CoA carboxylase, biotin carboxyl carrier protein [Deltaproteobacteria bacterium]|mgnify:CR=1 FL=1|nr:acetyl-CoA carboxylase, biotin carboxyl carrier protein [Deltaproteobacteria bacterium]HCH64956.1 acetyl-CoA carboxylase biotin carboxyl carrier protein [Deltaproteobacteria bacterium]
MSLSDSLPQIAELIALMRENDVSRIDYEDEQVNVSVRFGGEVVMTQAVAPAGAAPTAVADTGGAPATEGAGNIVKSPMVGTFYRSPDPSAPPFASPGDRIEKGQVLCIIEAMKLMNEIESEVSGVIAEVLVDNGQAVQFGQPMFRIEAG